MVKLQQFHVLKIHSDLLRFKHYELNYDINEARKKKWLVSLADSQALRTIRRIRYQRNPTAVQYTKEKLLELQQEKKQLLKENYSEANIARIKQISKEIDEMLLIPEYLLVVVDQSSQYVKAIKGDTKITINGYKYVRLLCGAGMARNNTVAFIREDFEQEVKQCLQNDYNKDILITDNKYNAYFALSSTATYLVSTPNVLLVDDCEIKMTKRVDWAETVDTDRALENKHKIITCNKELDFNLFDGGGLIDISKAKQWANELELDYIPSVFIIRNIFIKGCLFTVDFKKFAKEIANKKFAEDLYGNIQKIEDMDIILTKSQFKLWNAYKSMEHYQLSCDKYLNYWGVSRVAPKQDDDYVTTNYQFCQVFDLQDKDITELCETTVNWIKGVSGFNREQAMLFLMGSLSEKYDTPKETYQNISDNIVKALAINKQMINDSYVRQKLVSAINKKINESYIGKLIVRGCFSTMIPDIYAMMEWAFGLEVKGLLQEFEHYSQYWNIRGSTQAVGMRSPLTWRSEVNPMRFIQNSQTEEWYKYITSGIIYNVWGCDCMLHADADFDGDIVCTTDNPVFVRCRHTEEDYSLPITYQKNTVAKHKIKETNLHKADIKSFNSTIGQVTNYSTSFYDLLCKYKNDNSEYGRKCYEAIIERLKLTRKAQGDAIDAAKGIKCDPYPKHWITRQIILDNDSEEVKEYKKFLNDICADKKPYFFKYRYYQSKSNDDLFNEGADLNCYLKCDKKSIQDIISNPQTEMEIASVKDYESKSVLIDYDSPMNKICHYMENQLSDLKCQLNHSSQNTVDLLRTNCNVQDINKIQIVRDLCDEYYDEKLRFRKGINKSYNNIDQCAKHIREKSLLYFDNAEEVANYVVEVCYVQNYHQSKSFAWNVFGGYLLNNLSKNSKEPIQIPMKNDNGDINYLYNCYKLEEVIL